MFTPLGLALASMFLVTWMMAGCIVAIMTSGWVKGRTALERLPKNILIILFWPFWAWHILRTK